MSVRGTGRNSRIRRLSNERIDTRTNKKRRVEAATDEIDANEFVDRILRSYQSNFETFLGNESTLYNEEPVVCEDETVRHVHPVKAVEEYFAPGLETENDLEDYISFDGSEDSSDGSEDACDGNSSEEEACESLQVFRKITQLDYRCHDKLNFALVGPKPQRHVVARRGSMARSNLPGVTRGGRKKIANGALKYGNVMVGREIGLHELF